MDRDFSYHRIIYLILFSFLLLKVFCVTHETTRSDSILIKPHSNGSGIKYEYVISSTEEGSDLSQEK